MQNTSSNSSIDTLTPTSFTTLTQIERNGAKGKGKNFSIGEAIEIDQMSDISISTDRSLKVPIFSASPAPPSQKIQREGENRVAEAYTSMKVGVKRLGGNKF